MGKPGKWQKTKLWFDIIAVINSAPINVLIKIGKRVASTDFAIRFYNNKQHPLFYKQDEKVRKSIRRAWSIGAFNHREIILEMLGREGLLPPKPLKNDSPSSQCQHSERDTVDEKTE